MEGVIPSCFYQGVGIPKPIGEASQSSQTSRTPQAEKATPMFAGCLLARVLQSAVGRASVIT